MKQQHAVITGGGSGIGLACASVFLSQGYQVSLLGRSESRLKDACQSLGEGSHYWVCDVTDENSVAQAFDNANGLAPINVAIANAGTGGAAPFLHTQSEDWDRILQTNVNGTFYTFKYAGTHMAANGGGALCAISSIAGIRTHKLMSAYCSSKAAIDMLVRNTADELGAQNIRVNSVGPGLVETELSAGLHQTDAMRNDYLSCMPIARVGQPRDIAQAVYFLCSEQAAWITGVTLAVDGGHHLRRGPNLEVMM